MFKVSIPMYEPLEVSKCEKCGKVSLFWHTDLKTVKVFSIAWLKIILVKRNDYYLRRLNL